MRRRRNWEQAWEPGAEYKSVLLSPLEGAKIIKEDFKKGGIIAHSYNYVLGLVRSEEAWDEEFEERKKQDLS